MTTLQESAENFALAFAEFAKQLRKEIDRVVLEFYCRTSTSYQKDRFRLRKERKASFSQSAQQIDLESEFRHAEEKPGDR